MKTSLKEVKVIARYAHKTNGKLNGLVTYAVRSSNGETIYCSTLINGKASGCSCPSHKPCYHMKGLEQKESARQFAAKELPVWTIDLVKTGKLAAPKVAKVAEMPAPKRDMMSAALTTNQGFRLMR